MGGWKSDSEDREERQGCLVDVLVGSTYFYNCWGGSGRQPLTAVSNTTLVGPGKPNAFFQFGHYTYISWIRKRDLHILTSSTLAYTGDARFSVKHPESSDEWTLRIEYVQPRDAGVYECQVNTEPKMNLAFMLKVEAAQATILGPEDVYVKKGSTISLTGGVSLETEKTDTGTTSRLLVTQARLTDSGNYTCIPSNANPASVMVHVLNGEHPAAMQHGGSCGVAPTILLASITLIIANLLR
ncbi:Uncharacterized protein DBV15_06047 [Temnothorax longispinosus]|uniref:Ig-like domain-containing protein n=1 Tax=Temnothorax longispinosus TaxID=300112 RepID=A0A4S2L0B0_9HYME|nr:Uncharacterized protein DBV15_06047 [Temnothorax longispinosus]